MVMVMVLRVSMALVLVLVLILCSPDIKNRAARADDDDEAVVMCNMTRGGLQACKPAVSSGSTSTADPSKECCAALAGADLACLCSYRHSFLLPSFGIDPDLAMQLPAKCNLTAPPGC